MSELARPRPSPATSAAKCDSPPGFQDLGAAGVFADYLVLDAWVANQDRHDRNWAVLERADAHARRRLAASFDHTSSLGFNLLDAARRRILRDRAGIETWVARGRAGSSNTTPRRSPRSRRWCTRASRPSVARSTGRALLAGEAPQDRPTRCGVRGRASTRTVGAHGPVEVVIEHVNGVDAPVHLRLLVRLHQGDVPPGYRPMTGPRRETFAE